MTEYHAHVYFNAETFTEASRLREKLLDRIGGDKVSLLRHSCVGPHLSPMFEVLLDSGKLEPMIEFLELHRSGLSVLLHPVTEDDYKAHTDQAIWLGEILDLDLSKL